MEYVINMIKTLPGRAEVIDTFKKQGGTVAAVLPIYYPRALLRVFNFLPVEVWGPPGIGLGPGSTHLQPYICSIVHNPLSFLHDGGLDAADVIVVPHACDSLQGLGSILIDFISSRQAIIPIYLPRQISETSLDYFAAELNSAYEKLTEITGHTPSDDELMECIYREESADSLLTELHRNRVNLPFSNLVFYTLVRSREYLPAETFITFAREALASASVPECRGTRILLSGIVPEPMDLFAVITELDGLVVADDLACCGRRLYPPGSSHEPFHRMAERILNAPPCPTRGNPISERDAHLLTLVEATEAKGIIFYDVKFCEPELFDLPILRNELSKRDIPSITIEVDINDPLSHQVRTRLEAFLEMLQ
jgi:benzoyl-CoA reductase/2-hydroxyglutaryl-CoA dehydratase subunit BcrC/BadD/HgdB